MANRVLRDHSEGAVCDHSNRYTHKMQSTKEGYAFEMCPGGWEVTAAEIQEMAYSLWQAEQMDEYHRDVL